MNSTGSVWQKWDLHIHTPASYHWNGARFVGQSREQVTSSCKTILDHMNAIDVAAFCIMDYWTFDGYIALRSFIERTPGYSAKPFFPGIELRLAAPTNFRLNTHVLFSDCVSTESLHHFLSHLKLADYETKPPTRQHLIDLGRSYDEAKLKLHGVTIGDKSDEDKMHRVGLMTALVTRESVRDAINVVGKDYCLVIQPYDTSDGLEDLDWKRHPYTDSYLMKWADCFETRDPVHVDLFLGHGHKTKAHVGAAFVENLGGYPKPVFSGSDAHRLTDYGRFPSDRVTWLKATPTFKGLKQVCHEPAMRCFIGVQPPKLAHVANNRTKYITQLQLSKDPDSKLKEHWFDGQTIQLNPGLVAIIGNKGSGKSALADILALAGNSHCTRMEFLNDKRFRSSGNKAKHFSATITWADESEANVELHSNADLQQPERIRYLPQHFIEDLCNEIATGNEANFSKELRKVIFSHIPDEEQLRMGTLDELLSHLIEAHREAIAQLQQTVRTLNDVINRSEQEISPDALKSYRTALGLKKSELDALDKSPPAEVPKPQEDPEDEKTKDSIRQIDDLKKQLASLQLELIQAKSERAVSVARQASLIRLQGHVDNLETSYLSFVEKHKQEFEDAGFEIATIVTFSINREPLLKEVESGASRLSSLTITIDGNAIPGGEVKPGLVAREAECIRKLAQLQETLNAPEKAYQKYLRDHAEWNARRLAIIGSGDKPETIEFLVERIQRATEIIPDELSVLREQRRDFVRRLHSELLQIRRIYEQVYAPVQTIASQAATTTDSIQLEFDAYLSTSTFESNFLDFIRKNRKGNFYGEEESRKAVRDLIQAHDFETTDSVVAFTDAVMDALTTVNRDGQVEPVSIQTQLREQKKVTDLYDYLFSLNYLEVEYTLRLGGKDISQLSPGEKGALLLVFYLLLDTEEIPIIIDQPEHNLDNESVVRLLVDCIRRARARRQVMIVTHNPNLAVYCDADQIVCCSIDKTDGHKITYTTGAIEDYDINQTTVNVLEGTYPAFDNRRRKYHPPQR